MYISMEDNEEVAVKRLFQTTKKIKQKSDGLKVYDSTIREYIMSGMVEKAEDANATSNPCYYMPHNAII